MGREIIGSFIMALGGFFLMLALAGRAFEIILRIICLVVSIPYFFIGMKIFREYMPEQSGIDLESWLTITLALLTPFVVIFLLDLLGMVVGIMGVFVWLMFAVVILWKWERIMDRLFPRFKEKESVKSEELRRRLNPRLYLVERKEKKK
jgi:L-asparagine transporter-like permease